MSNRQVRWQWLTVEGASTLYLEFPNLGLEMDLSRRPFQRAWNVVVRRSPQAALHPITYGPRRRRQAMKIVRNLYAVFLAEKFAGVTHAS